MTLFSSSKTWDIPIFLPKRAKFITDVVVQISYFPNLGKKLPTMNRGKPSIIAEGFFWARK
jgi:hypothetical protein